MAEMTTAISSIKISDFLKACAKYKYYLPQSFEAELNNRTNEIVDVIYADEYSPKWSIHRDHIIVNRYFSREMNDEIQKLKSLCSNKEQIILELIKSFNADSNLPIEQSVDCAIRQYEYFKKEYWRKIIMAKWVITACPDEEDYSAGRKSKIINAKDYDEAIDIAWKEFPEYHEVKASLVREV